LENGEKYKATYIEDMTEENVLLTTDLITRSVSMDFVDPVEEALDEILNPEEEFRRSAYERNPNMTIEDIKSLENSIIDRGFSGEIFQTLHENIAQGKKEFELSVVGRKDEIEYVARLKFVEDSAGKVQFESYKLTIEFNDHWKENFTQSFKVGDALDLKLNEAFNLMRGRSVLLNIPDGEDKFNKLWVQMDFNKAFPNGNYPVMPIFQQRLNVRQGLDRFQILNLEYDDVKARFVYKLERGDQLQVAINSTDGPNNYKMNANPFINGFDFRAKNGELVYPGTLMKAGYSESPQMDYGEIKKVDKNQIYGEESGKGKKK
jgi:hypothetical protein